MINQWKDKGERKLHFTKVIIRTILEPTHSSSRKKRSNREKRRKYIKTTKTNQIIADIHLIVSLEKKPKESSQLFR